MAVKGSLTASMRMPAGVHLTQVTLPSEALCHYITDDELDRLSEMRKEPVMEIFLASVGAFLGGLIPAAQELTTFLRNPESLTGIGLLTILVCVAALSIGLVSGFLWHQRGKAHKSMSQTIRDRPRVPVHQA